MTVDATTSGGICEIRLNNPAVHNAIGMDEAQELSRHLSLASSNPDIRCIILTGQGSSFCAGGNLRTIAQIAARGPDAVRESVYGVFQALFRTLESSVVPVIAAVDGPAIGVGADLALAADLTFVGREGWLSQGWAKAGLIPATGGIEYVRRRSGRSAFWQFLLEDRLDGRQLQELGLAVAVDSAASAAAEAGRRLAVIPRTRLAAMRALTMTSALEEHLALALDYQVEFLSSGEFLQLARSRFGLK